MIKINLLAERKPAKASKASPGIQPEAAGTGRNILLVGVLVIGVLVAGGWWWTLDREIDGLHVKLQDADKELLRLEAAIKKSEEYEAQRDLLARKISLITNLKKQQDVPVHILDQVSRNLPDFLWLESMTANRSKITISGKATTYAAVSNFYTNLTDSGHFANVALGRTFEVPAGVSFSLTCSFATPGVTVAKGEAQSEQG
jgi:Tfp pilus assembly protein PilN